MATKKGKNNATDELDSLFEGIGDEKKAAPSTKKSTAGKAAGKAGTKAKTAAASSAAEKDILAELENELGEQGSRPHTPRTKGSPAPPQQTALPRRSAESSKAYSARNSTDERTAAAPVVVETAQPEPASAAASSGGGGWWGGILSTASAAMKQAEAAVKEIQQNEEAKKWADQVRGNYTTLRGLGDELRTRALPTFTNILHTLAPPIASHERLLIHITHDMVGYPSLDPLVHDMFLRVMSQVEGGDLLVIQRGQEAQPGGNGGEGTNGSGAAGWRDGPWWRVVHQPRDLGTVAGLREGTKLCRASAEAYANEYYAAHYGASDDGTSSDSKRGLEVARQRAAEPVSEANPVRRSDLFLAVQALSVDADKESDASDKGNEEDDLVMFAVYILDPVHDIVYHTVSQALPAKWVRWLDARPPGANTLTPATSGGEEDDTEEEEDYSLPDDIREIIEGGGVDPREWVAEWIEETLSLAIGVVAQRYVAHRMGVGAGSIGRGKRPLGDILADNAGEAARAV
ncbi:hypothetical protein SEUCBS139899_010484 [Sporothrix eucalyptigena]|uniref:Maintenance of telomere capping protein 1 n=1 Tax=Sporothrix eucalyptigena TaxID=1812306 RepID=A0ABP0CSS3_9PEZI